MRQSERSPQGLHVGIIMDGNGRWAEERGRARPLGHRAGADAVRRVVEAAPSLGIGTLTLYAFSADNWRRPRGEVDALLRLFGLYLRQEAVPCSNQGVRLNVIGRRDRLPLRLVSAIRSAERLTAGGRRLLLRLAVDYSARSSIVCAAGRIANRSPGPAGFRRALAEVDHAALVPTDVDLVIRTGGELRLSDFQLWECAYAELWFNPVLWPDFTRTHLEAALRDFHARTRRFGGVEPADEIAHRPELLSLHPEYHHGRRSS